MSRTSKRKQQVEEERDVFSMLEEEGLSPEEVQHHGQVLQLAEAIDARICSFEAPNSLVVSALTVLLRHASAQMYSAAFHSVTSPKRRNAWCCAAAKRLRPAKTE